MPTPLQLPPRAPSPRTALRSIVEAATGGKNGALAGPLDANTRPRLAGWLRTGNVETLLPVLAEARSALTPEQDKSLFGGGSIAPQASDADEAFVSDYLELAAITAEEALEAAQHASGVTTARLADKALELCLAAFGPVAQETEAARRLCIESRGREDELAQAPTLPTAVEREPMSNDAEAEASPGLPETSSVGLASPLPDLPIKPG